MAEKPKSNAASAGMPMDETVEIPVGVRAMMTATNLLHGSI
ncbi:MAG: hypothetical protein ACI4KA_11305 [Oscillospiraceae bacterium]